MKKILVIGSMNLDFVTSVPHMPRVGETVLAQGLELVPGGKGANQAYAIGRLGGRAAMLGCLGQDSFGDRLLENLSKAGVDTQGVERRVEASTSMAVIGVDPQGDNSILVLPGANGLVDRAMVDRHLDLLEGCDILAMQLEIPLDTVAYAAKKAKELGKTVVLDPAPAVPDLPEELYPCLDSARLLRQRGAGNVLVTLGAEGSYLLEEDGRETRIPGDKTVQAVDTTAAGDSYLAGVCVALSQGKDLPQAAALASAVASLVVTRRGAQTSIPDREEVGALLEKLDQ